MSKSRAQSSTSSMMVMDPPIAAGHRRHRQDSRHGVSRVTPGEGWSDSARFPSGRVPSVTSQPFVVGTVLNEHSPPAHLSVRNLEVVYNDVALVLRGVTLEVPRGGIAALLGANGAGKTTLLRAITGLLRIHRGAITKGDVLLDGDSITGHDPAQIVRHGISHVMEGRRIFAELTVEENLRAGAYTKRDRNEVKRNHERVMELFPVLADRRRSVAGYLSGGEQQMLAMGRSLMQSPDLPLLDEPSDRKRVG